MRTIAVVASDPRWPAQFAAEAVALRALLGDQVIELHHIGSTAVPGLVAKPIIDLLLVTRDLAPFDAHAADLRAAGWLPRGEAGIPGRRHFIKGSEDLRTHHLHAFAPGHPAIAAHLRFRDALRADAAARLAYGELKAAWRASIPMTSPPTWRGSAPSSPR